MIALLSALLGFISSAFPDFLKLFRDGRDRAHEITLLKLQMDYDREKLAVEREGAQSMHAYKLQEIALAERQALNLGAGTTDGAVGIRWVDGLAGSVRPIVTYCFFAMYFTVKLCQFRLLLDPAMPWQQSLSASQAIVTLWTDDDMGIFAAVIAFWFGSRALGKRRAL